MINIDPTIIVAAIALLGGGGIAAAFAMLVKVRPEAAKISVDAAQGAVIVQKGVIESLKEELERLKMSEQDCLRRVETLTKIVKGIDDRKNPDINRSGTE